MSPSSRGTSFEPDRTVRDHLALGSIGLREEPGRLENQIGPSARSRALLDPAWHRRRPVPRERSGASPHRPRRVGRPGGRRSRGARRGVPNRLRGPGRGRPRRGAARRPRHGADVRGRRRARRRDRDGRRCGPAARRDGRLLAGGGGGRTRHDPGASRLDGRSGNVAHGGGRGARASSRRPARRRRPAGRRGPHSDWGAGGVL